MRADHAPYSVQAGLVHQRRRARPPKTMYKEDNHRSGDANHCPVVSRRTYWRAVESMSGGTRVAGLVVNVQQSQPISGDLTRSSDATGKFCILEVSSRTESSVFGSPL